MKVKTMSAASASKSKKIKRATVEAKPDLLSRIKARPYHLSIALLVVAVAICYANSLWNGFVFDDHDLVLQNKLLRSIANIPLLLNSYRPLRDISYVIDFALWGERPFGFHLSNIIIHAVNTVLVFTLIRKLTGQTLASLLAALIFAVHPIQTDAVAYVSGRRDVLFSLFYLAAFHSYLTYRRNRSYLYFALFLAFWGLSLLSKEMAVSLPIFIFVWNFCDLWPEEKGVWFRQFLSTLRKSFSRDKWLYIALSLAGIAYAWYWIFIKRASVRASFQTIDYWGGSFYANILTAIRVHAWYLKQLVYPTPIAQYFGAFEISRSILDWRVLLSIFVVGGVFASGMALLRRERLMAFAILSYFALLLPVSQLIPHHELLADHYLYLPMMSFGLFLSLLIQKIAAKDIAVRKIAYGTAAMVVLILCLMTVMRNREWKDDYSLWLSNYKAVPNSTRAAFNLAGQYLSRNPTKAEELYRRSLELDPTYAPTYTKLAQIYLSQNRVGDVEELIEKGLSLSDSDIQSFMTREPQKFRSQLTAWLAAAKGKKGDQRGAEELLREAIRLYPPNMEPYAMLATSYHNTDRAKEITILQSAVTVNPYAREMFERLSSLLVEDKKYGAAIPYLQRILQLVPTDFYANYQLGQIYRIQNDCAKARQHFVAARSAATTAEARNIVGDAIRQFERQCGVL